MRLRVVALALALIGCVAQLEPSVPRAARSSAQVPSADAARVRIEKEKPLETPTCGAGTVEGSPSEEVDNLGLALERAIEER